MQPLAIDLFCGLGGWTEGLIAEGYYVVGFDIERHVYGEQRYPAQLVIQDVLTLHGKQFKSAALIVASPPCQEYSYMAMPWSRAKQKIRDYETGVRDVKALTALFDACFRIQREACDAAGRHIPLVVENVRGAQRWVGRSRWNFGSFHLWGDVPALMPIVKKHFKAEGKNWNEWKDWDGREETKPPSVRPWGDTNQRDELKGHGGSWFGDYSAMKAAMDADGLEKGGDWFNASQPSISRRCSSKSTARKAASAMIAKIPLVLSRHIAACWKPDPAAPRTVRP